MFSDLTSNFIFASVIGALLVVALIAGLLLRQVRLAGTKLAQATWKISDLPQIVTSARLHELDEIIEELPSLGDQWFEFKEGLVQFPPGLVGLHWGDEQRREVVQVPAELLESPEGLHNSLPITSFFTDDAFLADLKIPLGIRFPILHQLPGIATSLGVLGTFLGVTFGLNGLEISNVGSDSTAVQQLISSLGAAFMTSIAGVSVSLVLNLFINRREATIRVQMANLREAIERRIPRVTPEKLLVANAHYQKQQLELTASSTKAGSDALEELRLLRSDGEQSRGLLQELVDDFVEKLGDRMDQAMTASLGPALEEITAMVRQQIEDTTKDTSSKARDFTNEMVTQLSGSLQQSFGSMGSQVEAMGAQMAAVTSSLDAVVTKAESATSEQQRVFELAARALDDAQTQAVSNSQNVADGQRLASSLSTLVESLAHHREQSDQLQQSQAALQTTAQYQIKEVSDAVAATSASYQAAASKLQELMPQLQGHLDALSGAVGSMSKATQLAAQTTERSSKSLVDRASSEQELLTGFGKVARDFEGAVRTSAGTLSALDSAATAVAARYDQLDALTAALTNLTVTLREASASSAQSLGTVSVSLKTAAEELDEAVTSTHAWTEGTSAAITGFAQGMQESVRASLTEFDSSLAGAVDGLSGATKGLLDIAEEIADNAQRSQRGVQ